MHDRKNKNKGKIVEIIVLLNIYMYDEPGAIYNFLLHQCF